MQNIVTALLMENWDREVIFWPMNRREWVLMYSIDEVSDEVFKELMYNDMQYIRDYVMSILDI